MHTEHGDVPTSVAHLVATGILPADQVTFTRWTSGPFTDVHLHPACEELRERAGLTTRPGTRRAVLDELARLAASTKSARCARCWDDPDGAGNGAEAPPFAFPGWHGVASWSARAEVTLRPRPAVCVRTWLSRDERDVVVGERSLLAAYADTLPELPRSTPEQSRFADLVDTQRRRLARPPAGAAAAGSSRRQVWVAFGGPVLAPVREQAARPLLAAIGRSSEPLLPFQAGQTPGFITRVAGPDWDRIDADTTATAAWATRLTDEPVDGEDLLTAVGLLDALPGFGPGARIPQLAEADLVDVAHAAAAARS